MFKLTLNIPKSLFIKLKCRVLAAISIVKQLEEVLLVTNSLNLRLNQLKTTKIAISDFNYYFSKQN